jgi:diguanylate cyclase (GGDEF)-like protein
MRLALRDYDYLGRFGGEEFLAILPDCGPEQSVEVADRMRVAVAAEPVDTPDGTLSITASFGIGWTSTPGAEPESLIQSADEALYRAKGHGRNRVEIQSVIRTIGSFTASSILLHTRAR